MDGSGSGQGSGQRPSVGRPAMASDRIALLTAHFVAHLDRYTPEALRTAAIDIGHAPEEVDLAMAEAEASLERSRLAKPARNRAKTIVVAAYLVIYGLFVFAMLGTRVNDQGLGTPLLAILTVALAIGLLVSRAWVNRRTGSLAVMLAAPFVVLVVVSGLCLATIGSSLFPTTT